MNVNKLHTVKLLWLAPILAVAAAIFVPDLVNTTTLAIQPVGYIGSPIASGYNLTSGNKSVYIIDYSSQDWSGDMHAYPISSTGVVSGTDTWTNGAATAIDTQNEAAGVWNSTGRNIITMNGSSKIAFVWGSLSTTQKAALDSASASASASPILNYVRGDRSNEISKGGTYRTRTTVLGDIIHSTPVYWDDGTDQTVFVGANDGMLHALNASTGAERFAYIPSVLISKLPALIASPYSHKYYVDGQLAARKFGAQSILAGGLGGGGKGLFALDITAIPTSETNAATKILWEVSNTTSGFSNLGHTYGTPVLTTLANDTNVLVAGNGYNNTGNGHATLFVLNPATGAKISEIDTGIGTLATPNGLSSPTIVDDDLDGKADYAYAGDIDGNLWKFNLATNTATKLYTTSPVQPITMAPGYKSHPNGGYMITFATGRIFEAADESDTATHYAYGIWDRPTAYSTNDTLLTQTLTETSYTGATPNIRVRTATNALPDWTAGAGHHMGWKTPLPVTGERVVGDGAFVTGSTFLFLSTNPTANTTQTPSGENWWMQLNALTGGDNGTVKFDLNTDGVFTATDKVTVTSGSTSSVISPVGRHLGGGIRSQLTAFTTAGFDIYLANYDKNGDPPVSSSEGVAGGHFDEDNYFGSYTGDARATARITVGTNGQTNSFPATLGAITVNGVEIVPALTVTDIPNGTATTTNATTIKNRVAAVGYSATVSGNVITITAPSGAFYNGKTIDIADGTSQTLVTPIAASPAVSAVAAVSGSAPNNGSLVISAVARNKSVSIRCGTTFVGSAAAFTSSNSTSSSTRLSTLGSTINGVSNGGYTVSCTGTSFLSCAITAPVGVSACAGGFTVDSDITVTNNTGPSGGVNPVAAVVASPAVSAVPRSGWSNFKPALTTTTFSGGVDGVTTGDTCDGNENNNTECTHITHVHQYDDKYGVTGVNYLGSSSGLHNLSRAISPSMQFKVIAQNQYLNPALEIHIGDPSYKYNLDVGYIPIKNFVTSSTLDVTTLPTYTLSAIGSLAVNMPVDALTAKNWWGNGDVRAGLHPSPPSCVYDSAGTRDGNMYQPVIPPANGTNGPGVKGWSSSTTPATATGARHGGALVIQIIRANTPNSAIEQNVPGRPEYGWRVKSASFSTYVLSEYTTWWHHPNNICYGDTGWTKTPDADDGSSTQVTKSKGSSDPQIGSLGVPVAGTTTTTVTNSDGTTTTTVITVVINANGTATVTTTATNSSGGTTTTVTGEGIDVGGAVNASGVVGGGVTSPLEALGRVSWRELFR